MGLGASQTARTTSSRTRAQVATGSLQPMKLSLPPKFVEKEVWVPVILFCKISFPV